jgi:hypothetical protein
MITGNDEVEEAAAASGDILLLAAVVAANAEVAVAAHNPRTIGKRK